MTTTEIGYLQRLRAQEEWSDVERILLSSGLSDDDCVRPISEAEARQISTWRQMGPDTLDILAVHGIGSEEEYIQSLVGKTPQQLTASAVVVLVGVRQKLR